MAPGRAPKFSSGLRGRKKEPFSFGRRLSRQLALELRLDSRTGEIDPRLGEVDSHRAVGRRAAPSEVAD
jgi:hypothetical protein